MNLREKEFRPWRDGYYMVSQDGYIYVTQSSGGGIAGRFLLPTWQHSTATMNVRKDGRVKQIAASTITLEVWGERIKTSKESVAKMRDVVCTYHEKYMDLASHAKNSAISNSLLEKNENLRSVMPCPWATPGKLGAGPEGVSWYSAQADPMTMGVWLTGNLETVRAKEVAA